MPHTPTALTKDLRDLIKFARDAVGLSQRQAGLAAGFSAVWWRTIESGQVETVPADTVARMAYAVDVSPDQLRNIGNNHVADLVERRRALLAPEPAGTEDEAEQHLLSTPGATEGEARALVAYWRTLRQTRTG